MRLRIFQILLFVGLLLSTFQVWSLKSIRLTTQITTKHPITIQVFYTENDLEGFSQPKSTKKQVMVGTTDFSIDIPAQSLTSLRMDFDSNPGEVKFTPPKIYGTTQIDLKSYKPHFSPDIENTNVSNSQEHIIASTKKDPYVYWEGLSVESKISIFAIYKHLPLIILYFIFLWLLSVLTTSFLSNTLTNIRKMRLDCTNSNDSRIISFDCIRVLAFFFVVIYHVIVHSSVNYPHSHILGKIGVSLFFILSGASLAISTLNRQQTFCSFYIARLKTLLPSFWVAYFIVLMINFYFFKSIRAGTNLLILVPSIFGMDGYFVNRYPTYYLIGEWFLGSILIAYLFIPFLYKMVLRKPICTLLGFFTISLFVAYFTPQILKVIPFWNPATNFNFITHLFELAFGITFTILILKNKKLYLLIGCGSIFILLLLFSIIPIKNLCCNLKAISYLIPIIFFVALNLIFSIIPWGEHTQNAIAYLGKTSYLAFLYHHKLIYWLLPNVKINAAESLSNYELLVAFLLISSLSFVLATLSLKPVKALTKIVFGESMKKNFQSCSQNS